MVRRALLIASTLVIGCAGGSSAPSAPSAPALPQIAGTYTGPTVDSSTSPPMHPLTWTIQFALPGFVSPHFRGCDGIVVIQQTGSTLAGSFSQGGACPTISGQITSGTIRSDGTVTLSLMGPPSDPFAWTGFAGCTPVVSGTTDLTGRVTDVLLDASFAHDALIDCPNDGFVTLNVHLRANRQ